MKEPKQPPWELAEVSAYSEASRPPVPTEGDHRFRLKPTTHSDGKPTTWR